MSLLARMRTERTRRSRRKNLFAAPGGGTSSKSQMQELLTKAPKKLGRKKSAPKKKGQRKKTQKSTAATKANPTDEAFKSVLFNMKLDKGAPEQWPGMEAQKEPASGLDKLFDTYWGATDTRLADVSEDEQAENLSMTLQGFALNSPVKRKRKGAKGKFNKSPKQFLQQSPGGSKRARQMLANTLKLKKKNQKSQQSAKERLLNGPTKTPRRKSLLTSPLAKGFKSPGKPKSPLSNLNSLLTPSSRGGPRVLPSTPSPNKGTPKTLLPIKMKTLMKKFSAAESVFRYHSGRGQFGSSFAKLKTGVERVCKKEFTEEDLAKLARVVPDLFHIRWGQEMKKDGSKKAGCYVMQVFPKNHLSEDPKSTMHTHFLKGAVCEARLELITNRLHAYTKAKHAKWLRDEAFDAPIGGRFHPEFRLDDVDVKKAELPKRPKRTGMSAREALLNHGKGTRVATDAVQERLSKLSASERVGLSDCVKNAMKEYNRRKSKRVNKKNVPSSNLRGGNNEEEKLDMSRIPENLRHLPRTTLLKLQGRTKVKDILKVDKVAQERKVLLEELPELVRTIKAYLRSNRRTAMPLNVLVVRIASKMKSRPNPARLQTMIKELVAIVPEFCSVETTGIKILKLKSGCNPSSVYAKIKAEVRKIKL